MAYCTLNDLGKLISENILLQLADDDGVGQFVTEEPINNAYSNVLQAINDADTVINSYLAGRYQVPIVTDPIPPVVVQISQNLALCNLYERRRELDMPEGIKNRRDRNIGLLKDIKMERAEIPELENTSANITPAPFNVTVSSADVEFPNTLLNMM